MCLGRLWRSWPQRVKQQEHLRVSRPLMTSKLFFMRGTTLASMQDDIMNASGINAAAAAPPKLYRAGAILVYQHHVRRRHLQWSILTRLPSV